MKKLEFINSFKIKFESGFKTFDKQTNYISTGNVISNTQYSGFVRASTDKKCNNLEFRENELQNFDLSQKWAKDSLTYYEADIVKRLANESGGIILYSFHHWRKGKRIIDGLAVTDRNHNLLWQKTKGKTWKSSFALCEAVKYISN